jgi:hypothetical protein
MLLADELATDEREDDAIDELTTEERTDEATEDKAMLEDDLTDEVAVDEVPPEIIPKGAGCALHVEAATQLLPFS